MCILCARCLHVNENDKGITACNEKNVDISAQCCIQNVVKKQHYKIGTRNYPLRIIDVEETCIMIITFIMRNMMITTTHSYLDLVEDNAIYII